tara:strand:- start:1034 stop:1498 length:465 start_codon:yes stop_codon:yes gene_type:complete
VRISRPDQDKDLSRLDNLLFGNNLKEIDTLSCTAAVLDMTHPRNGMSGLMKYSNHARRRTQQRGIPAEVVSLLLEFGDTENAGDGASIYSFRSKHIKDELIRESAMRGVKSVERYLHTYLVMSDDEIIVTVGHRYKRVKRDFRKGKKCNSGQYH